MENQVETIKYTPEKAKQNALAKLDLIRKWQEFRAKAVNKLQAEYNLQSKQLCKLSILPFQKLQHLLQLPPEEILQV